MKPQTQITIDISGKPLAFTFICEDIDNVFKALDVIENEHDSIVHAVMYLMKALVLNYSVDPFSLSHEMASLIFLTEKGYKKHPLYNEANVLWKTYANNIGRDTNTSIVKTRNFFSADDLFLGYSIEECYDWLRERVK